MVDQHLNKTSVFADLFHFIFADIWIHQQKQKPNLWMWKGQYSNNSALFFNT